MEARERQQFSDDLLWLCLSDDAGDDDERWRCISRTIRGVNMTIQPESNTNKRRQALILNSYSTHTLTHKILHLPIFLSALSALLFRRNCVKTVPTLNTQHHVSTPNGICHNPPFFLTTTKTTTTTRKYHPTPVGREERGGGDIIEYSLPVSWYSVFSYIIYNLTKPYDYKYAIHLKLKTKKQHSNIHNYIIYIIIDANITQIHETTTRTNELCRHANETADITTIIYTINWKRTHTQHINIYTYIKATHIKQNEYI